MYFTFVLEIYLSPFIVTNGRNLNMLLAAPYALFPLGPWGYREYMPRVEMARSQEVNEE
jgi:hypothetical protein